MLLTNLKGKKDIVVKGQQEERKFKLISAEFLFTLWATLVVSGSLDALFWGNMGMESRNFVRKLCALPAYFYAFIYMAVNYTRTKQAITSNISLSLLFLYMFCSSLWSIDYFSTLVRSINVLVSSSFGLYLAVRYDPKTLIELIGKCFLVTCLFSLSTLMFDPSYAIHHDQHFPAVRAYFIHKNQLGSAAAFIVLLSIFLYRNKETKGYGLLLFLLSSLLVVLSLSRTSWLALCFTFSSLIFISFVKRNKIIGIVLSLGVSILVFTLLLSVGTDELALQTANLIGRDLTLTGRTEIWEHLVTYVIPQRAWLGYGFESFWTSSSPMGAYGQDWLMNGFVPAHAHNAWLQVIVNLGFVGLIMFVWVWVKAFQYSIKTAFEHKFNNQQIWLFFLILYFSMNMTENRAFLPENFIWIFFVYVAYRSKFSMTYPLRKAKKPFITKKTHEENNT